MQSLRNYLPGDPFTPHPRLRKAAGIAVFAVIVALLIAVVAGFTAQPAAPSTFGSQVGQALINVSRSTPAVTTARITVRCAYSDRSTHTRTGTYERWTESRTRTCGTGRDQQYRSDTVYSAGHIAETVTTRTEHAVLEFGSWTVTAEHQVRQSAYVNGETATTVTDIKNCLRTVTRHAVYPTGTVRDTTTTTPTC